MFAIIYPQLLQSPRDWWCVTMRQGYFSVQLSFSWRINKSCLISPVTPRSVNLHLIIVILKQNSADQELLNVRVNCPIRAMQSSTSCPIIDHVIPQATWHISTEEEASQCCNYLYQFYLYHFSVLFDRLISPFVIVPRPKYSFPPC